MKKILILPVAALILMSACSALKKETADTPENRKAQAEKYLQVNSFESMISDSIDEMAKQVPEESRQKFVDGMKKSIQVDNLKSVAIESMTKHFTVKELEALTAFYGSPEGKSVMKKFGSYMADVMPIIQQQVMQAIQAQQEQLAPAASK